MTSHLSQNQSQTPHTCLQGAPYNLATASSVHLSSLSLLSLCSSHTGPLDIPQILQMCLASRSFHLFLPLGLHSLLMDIYVTCSLGSFSNISSSVRHPRHPRYKDNLHSSPMHSFSNLLSFSPWYFSQSDVLWSLHICLPSRLSLLEGKRHKAEGFLTGFVHCCITSP